MSGRGTPVVVAPVAAAAATAATSSEYKSCPYFPVPIQAESKNSKDSRQLLQNGMHRSHRILSAQELALGRPTRWMELEITGKVKNLSPGLYTLRHLTSLFLNGNHLTRLPPDIAALSNLCLLDLSHNKLRSLPTELGDMISLVHLLLNYNHIRVLPYELGKLFRMTTLGLHGNPLSPEISKLYHEPNGTQKLMQHLLDHLASSLPHASHARAHPSPRCAAPAKTSIAPRNPHSSDLRRRPTLPFHATHAPVKY